MLPGATVTPQLGHSQQCLDLRLEGFWDKPNTEACLKTVMTFSMSTHAVQSLLNIQPISPGYSLAKHIGFLCNDLHQCIQFFLAFPFCNSSGFFAA
jgi:hypothetical protein